MNRETAERLIERERERQIDEEGWDEGHDDLHHGGEIFAAASAYFEAGLAPRDYKGRPIFMDKATGIRLHNPPQWPWDEGWWKPKTPLRDFVRAGALFLAEKDRLKRLQVHGAAVDPDTIDVNVELVITQLLALPAEGGAA